MSEKTQQQKTPRKPLLFAENPLNDIRVRGSEARPEHIDPSFVPGYSDVKRINDLRIARGQEPLPQSARAQWVRVTRRDGNYVSATDEGMMEWMKLGYQSAGLDDLKRLGWEMPPTAEVGPDGLIRRGDLALFYVDAERAEENRAEQRGINAATEERLKRLESDTKSLEVLEDERTDKRGSLEELSRIELPNLED